jgi:tetratricopeptide (TPR) repeat protein
VKPVSQTALLVASIFLIAALLACDVYADDDWIRLAYHDSIAAEQVENYGKAIDAMLPVLRAYPEAYTPNLRLGWLYYLDGRYRNSFTHYEQAIKAYSASLEARNGLMLPLMAQQKYAEVEQQAYQVLNVDYYNYFANLRLATALLGQKKYKLVTEVALKMTGINPTSIEFLQLLAQGYAGLGELDKASATFADVAILDPGNQAAAAFFKPQ